MNAPPADAPRIAVFAKAPVPGAVKTRLVPLLGAQGAANLHSQLLHHALATAAQTAPAVLQLWCAPDTTHAAFRELSTRFACELRAQRGADLGERMSAAFDDAAPLIVIGSDCPALSASHLVQAWRMLRTHEAVVAPAEDGGYVLIGLARTMPSLFRGIDWGSAQVMRQTRARIAAAGIRHAELETLWDLDRPEDHTRLHACGIALEAGA